MKMKILSKFIFGVQMVATLFSATGPAQAVTVKELRAEAKLTPERFAKRFSDFDFKFHEEVQDARVFLTSKSGDCDDYGTLAYDVFKRQGYTPRLFAIRMKGETHVVCYIDEFKCYLDYNYRKEKNPVIPSDGSLNDIATKVAASFGRPWVAAYEFSWGDNIKRLVNNIVPNPSMERSKRIAAVQGPSTPAAAKP